MGKKSVDTHYLELIFVYFTEYLLAVEIDEEKHVGSFEDKRQNSLENKLGCKFIRINTSK